MNLRFDRPTEPAKDEQLYRRLRNLQVPVVVSMVSDQTGYSDAQIDYSRRYLQGLPAGVSLIYRDTIDQIARCSVKAQLIGLFYILLQVKEAVLKPVRNLCGSGSKVST